MGHSKNQRARDNNGSHTGPIVKSFKEFFDVVPAYSDALRERVFKIRYNVYAEELEWENREDFPEGLEQDPYDSHSVHCLLKHRPSDEYIGCVRLVLHNPADPDELFPMERTFQKDFLKSSAALAQLDRTALGEISRIAVLSSFRHRPGEQNIPNTDIEDTQEFDRTERRRFPHIALGLYLAAGAMGIARGKSAVFAMMEPKLARRLRIFGIHFEQIGDPIEHRGLRAPFLVDYDGFVKHMAQPMTELLAYIQQRIDASHD